MTSTATAPAPAWTADRVNRALFNHFNQQGWAVVFELGADDGRRIDLLLVRKARRMAIGPVDMLAIEVKVTRGDFLQDVRNPEKQQAWRATAHRHAYAAPKGMIRPEEVPAGSGLIELEDLSTFSRSATVVSWALKVGYAGHRPVPGWLSTSLAWRASWAEARLKGYTGVETYNDGSQTIESLRAQLANEKRRADKAENARKVADARTRTWRQLVGLMSGLPCETCGELLVPSRMNRNAWAGVVWRHMDKAHEPACATKRLTDGLYRYYGPEPAPIEHDDTPEGTL